MIAKPYRDDSQFKTRTHCIIEFENNPTPFIWYMKF